MGAFLISGGIRLNGSVKVQGAKNSVLPILAATILSGKETVIHNCPRLSDVDASIRILTHLGCRVKREGETVIVDSGPMSRHDIPDELMREMRSSVIFLGAIIARVGEASMSFPGGCELGPRPIGLHMAGLRSMGADVWEQGGDICCKAEKMIGCDINLSFPSVGATENLMLAACACDGVTRIVNAAREPEIVDLQEFLISIGVKVHGAGSSTVQIEGGFDSKPGEHKIMSDRIVAATYLSCVAAAGGKAVLEDVDPSHLNTVLSVLQEAGCTITVSKSGICISRDKRLKSVGSVRTMPYPGFPTDAQAPAMASLLCADGTTLFIETIFDSRFRHAGELMRMGADIKVEGKVAVICGVPSLHGAAVSATDLRGGAALAVAALAAEGDSRIMEIAHIDRGYDDFEGSLASLGADIRRVQ